MQGFLFLPKADRVLFLSCLMRLMQNGSCLIDVLGFQLRLEQFLLLPEPVGLEQLLLLDQLLLLPQPVAVLQL